MLLDKIDEANISVDQLEAFSEEDGLEGFTNDRDLLNLKIASE